MFILICLVSLFLVTSLITSFYNRSVKQKKLSALRNGWGHLKDDTFNFNRIEKYADRKGMAGYHYIDGQTKTDIDFQELFMVIDRTVSRVGQQLLYFKLQNPSNDIGQLRHFSQQVDSIQSDESERLAIQRTLLPLAHPDAYYIETVLNKRLIARPSWFNLLLLSPSSAIVFLLISIKFPVAIVWTLVPITLNMFIHFWNKSRTLSFTYSIPQLNVLIETSRNLNNLPSQKNPAAEKAVSELSSFQRFYQFLNIGTDSGAIGDLNIIAYYLSELLKGITLFEVFVFYKVISQLENKQQSIDTLFRFVGEVDVIQSVASLRSGHFKTCIPQFLAPGKLMIADELYHPLIVNCVTNSLKIQDKSILITGSNMSGKTTFLRALLINSILAQTISTCFAKSFATPCLKQFSSIRIADDVVEGKSLYFQEVDVMNKLVTAASSGQNLFVLDEVFKGTNTIERIAAAKAILSYLNQADNIVLVATHDYELTELLGGEYDLYHFTETIEGNDMNFDHTIKRGLHTTRNAIRVLELANFPLDVIREANALSDIFADGKIKKN